LTPLSARNLARVSLAVVAVITGVCFAGAVAAITYGLSGR
jgi:hypothetical protein